LSTAAQSSRTAIYDMLMQSQHWSPDQILAFQRSQIEQLLRHAKAHVPFYANRLDALFSASGEVQWEGWNDVPILTRKEVAQNIAALQAKELPTGHGTTQVAATSGSTGLPISVTFTQLLTDACKASDWRAQTRWGFDWSQNVVMWHYYGAQYAELGPMHDYGPWGPSHTPSSAKGKTFVHDTNASNDQKIELLKQAQAGYLFAQGNLPLSLAINLARQGEVVPLKAVVSTGTQMDDQFHSAIQTSFRAKSFAMYSSKEAGRIAHTCHESGSYHVNAECVFVEILDSRNNPCPPGVPGRVVVTTFYNAAQPFIRYEQGDIATWAAGCSCGTTMPVLERIDGREYHLFVRRDGTTFPPLVVDRYREEIDAEFWQFVQDSSNSIVVRYKPKVKRSLASEKAFVPKLRNILCDDFDIKFEIIDDVPINSSGKFIKYINACKP
jgi:phenylacetate-CoA ligase